MQKVKIFVIGKIKNKSLENEINEIKKRVDRLEIVYLKEVKEKDVKILRKKEFEMFKERFNSSAENFLLIEDGKEYLTSEFSKLLVSLEKEINFYVTGPFGPNDDLKKLIRNHLSLSKMTFTSQQALYLLVEQVYRAWCFEKKIPYSK